MSRIVHIALKCGAKEDLESAAKLYENIFGIYTTKSGHARGHLSQHMTDGNIDLALMLYDSEDEKEAKLAGAGPRIHHIGIEVEDRPSMIAKIEANGGTIYSNRAEGALKYRSPDGTLGEIVAEGRYPKKDMSKLSRISVVELQVNDIEKASNFYKEVFGFTEESKSKDEGSREIVLSDGETLLKLIQDVRIHEPAIRIWGMKVPDLAEATKQVAKYGGEIVKEDGTQVIFRGPDGNLAAVAAG